MFSNQKHIFEELLTAKATGPDSFDPEKTHLRTRQARQALVQQVQPSLQRAVDRSKQRLWETLWKLVERGLNDRLRGLL